MYFLRKYEGWLVVDIGGVLIWMGVVCCYVVGVLLVGFLVRVWVLCDVYGEVVCWLGWWFFGYCEWSVLGLLFFMWMYC